MSGPSGKHKSPRRLVGGWDREALAVTDAAAKKAGKSWAEWAREKLTEAALAELVVPVSK